VVTPALELRQVSVRAGARRLFEGVDLTLAPGERVALLGRNGAGKSTLLDLIAGVRRPDAGEVCVAGAPPPSRTLGWVPQDCGASLLPWLSVRDNVLLPLRLARASRIGCSAALDGVRGRLDPAGRIPVDASPATLSGGERQLVAWMRALIAMPALLVCDEPFAAVDLVVRARLDAVLDDLARGGTPPAVLLVTHDPRDVARHARRALLLEGGTLLPWIGAGAAIRLGAA
jgi:ABC-type nitrate/sulfonate/bicarbonate transport system ATPase subunit